MGARGNKSKKLELSAFCLSALRRAKDEIFPCQEINAGVSHKLITQGLITIVMRPSPYQRSKGVGIGHVQITDAGRARLKETV